jgi:hypothetical protein
MQTFYRLYGLWLEKKMLQKPSPAFLKDDFLNQMRQTADAKADGVIQYLFETNSADVVKDLMRNLTSNDTLEMGGLPEIVQTYFQENAILPPWADVTKMQRGSHFFEKNTRSIQSMLGFLALPYCYAAADGARVLQLSQRIKQDTQKRLQETAQFVLDVMRLDAFTNSGKGFIHILKVRLMHAAIRFHTLQSGKWHLDWGVPINQEDMSGTNLAFAWITLRGLRKSGYMMAEKDAEAYLHLWNVIGYLMGVQAELLPQNGKEAYWLDKKIVQRHFKKSAAGIELTQSLLKAYQQADLPFPKGFIQSYMRFLLGNEIADMLEIPPANWTQSLIPPFKIFNTLQLF